VPEPSQPFEPESILAALERHGVRYVLIGASPRSPGARAL